MDPITFIGVAIVVAGMVLIVAFAVSMAAEKPVTKTVSVELWCPVAAQLTLVRVNKSVDRRLSVVSCERFPDGAVTCEQGCIPARAAA